MAKDLTSVTLNALVRRAPSARLETPDGKVRGLYFVQQPTGAASWALRYRVEGVPKKLTIGPYPNIDLKTARDLATEASVALAKGADPAAEKKKAKVAARVPTDREMVENVVSSFIDRYAKKNTREASWRETERILITEVVGDGKKSGWKGKRLGSVTRADVHDLLDGIVDRGSPIMANRALAALRRMCAWAVERGIINTSPCENVKAPATEQSRDRVLSDEELALVWQGTDDLGWPFGPLFKLLLLTGQRRAEVAAMRWSEVDLVAKLWTLPKERVKNGTEHVVPLSTVAISILERLPRVKGDFVFTVTGTTSVSGFARAKSRIDAFMTARAGQAAAESLPHWTLHDLRRTAASGMARLGISLPTIEKVLNHTSGSFAGIVGVYQRHSFADEKRAALEAWGGYVEGLMNERVSHNILPLKTLGQSSVA